MIAGRENTYAQKTTVASAKRGRGGEKTVVAHSEAKTAAHTTEKEEQRDTVQETGSPGEKSKIRSSPYEEG